MQHIAGRSAWAKSGCRIRGWRSTFSHPPLFQSTLQQVALPSVAAPKTCASERIRVISARLAMLVARSGHRSWRNVMVFWLQNSSRGQTPGRPRKKVRDLGQNIVPTSLQNRILCEFGAARLRLRVLPWWDRSDLDLAGSITK